MLWTVISAVAAVISTITYILTAIYVRDQLKGQQKDRYLHVTTELFTNWQDRNFMEAQLWLIHRLQEKEWATFIARHRCDFGEIAFHQVGGFYDRVGTLVRLGFVNEQEILTTIGSHAIAVWDKIEPLVREARAIENSELFRDFERMLPACHACYVPALSINTPGVQLSTVKPVDDIKIDVTTLEQKIDRSDPMTILDVRQAAHVDQDRRALPHAQYIPPDEIESRYTELPRDREVIAYCT
jgi:hypothetical protein